MAYSFHFQLNIHAALALQVLWLKQVKYKAKWKSVSTNLSWKTGWALKNYEQTKNGWGSFLFTGIHQTHPATIMVKMVQFPIKQQNVYKLSIWIKKYYNFKNVLTCDTNLLKVNMHAPCLPCLLMRGIKDACDNEDNYISCSAIIWQHQTTDSHTCSFFCKTFSVFWLLLF